jgi:glycosyltransferase involved in cell wall biosynthesis
MLLRGGVRDDPRVSKEARTLADAGFRVIIVAMKVPGEPKSVERFGEGVVVVRTATGFLLRIKRLLYFRNGESGALPKDPGAREAKVQSIPWSRLALMLVSRVLIAFKMAGLALRTRPNVVHAHDFNTLSAGWMAAAVARVPLVYDAHEVNVDREGYYRQLRWLIYRMESSLIKRCDSVITTTNLRARHFRRVYHLNATPTVLQNRPVYRRVPTVRSLRSSFGVPEQSLLCIYQGGLQQGRGLHNLVRAVAGVERVNCVFLGDGHQSGSLRRLAQELGVADRIHHHPKVPLQEVAGMTASADVGIQVIRNTCFNHWSTDSNKLFEYVMAGIPVVASDFPEIRRVVREYSVGLLVHPESVADIAGALRRLRDDLNLRCRLKASVEASAVALSWSSQAPTLLALYGTLKL